MKPAKSTLHSKQLNNHIRCSPSVNLFIDPVITSFCDCNQHQMSNHHLSKVVLLSFSSFNPDIKPFCDCNQHQMSNHHLSKVVLLSTSSFNPDIKSFCDCNQHQMSNHLLSNVVLLSPLHLTLILHIFVIANSVSLVNYDCYLMNLAGFFFCLSRSHPSTS